jgi:hypothetical protein
MQNHALLACADMSATLAATAAAELERRYREGQAVYEEVMLHRAPGVCWCVGVQAGGDCP